MVFYLIFIKLTHQLMAMNLKKFMNFWGLYYPIILAFFSFVYSVILWFSGDKLEGIFVGIWVPSILSASVALRQRRSDYRDLKNK